jgi:hypothetical protein
LRSILRSRITKWFLVLVVALVGPGLFVASADTITTFNVSGTFADSSALSGTITINTTTGAITGASLVIGANTYSFLQLAIPLGSEFFAQFTTTSAFTFPFLDLFFPSASLVGYTGGALCTSSGPCANPTQYGAVAGTSIYLTQGSSVAAPEPSALILLSAGLIGLGLVARKRQFAPGRA